MKLTTLAFGLLVLLASATLAGDPPSMEAVVASPEDYAGQKLVFGSATLSGTITKYDAGNVRKYYLTVASRNKDLEAGFFLAPPSLADKLSATMSPEKNYVVNLTCLVEKVTINGVPQWHGIVTRVDFVDQNGNVTETVKIDKK